MSMPTRPGTAIVLEGHTLGVIVGKSIQILRASVLRGSPYEPMGCIALAGDRRIASRQDFEDFNVMWHPDYLVSDAPQSPAQS